MILRNKKLLHVNDKDTCYYYVDLYEYDERFIGTYDVYTA